MAGNPGGNSDPVIGSGNTAGDPARDHAGCEERGRASRFSGETTKLDKMIADCKQGQAYLIALSRRGFPVDERLAALSRKRSKLELYRFNLNQIEMFPKTPRQRRPKANV